MSYTRYVSVKSRNKSYHLQDCPYAKKIKAENREIISEKQAKMKGYHKCSFCCNIKYRNKRMERGLISYANNHGMNIRINENIIYVQSDNGFWKIVYNEITQDYTLYHRNHSEIPVDTMHPENENFHRQKDVQPAEFVMKFLSYIYKHDKFRRNEHQGIQNMPKRTKKQKQYVRAAKNREKRKSARRVDQIFKQLEKGTYNNNFKIT